MPSASGGISARKGDGSGPATRISSSMAREMIRYRQPLEKYLPAEIIPMVREMTQKRKEE